MKNRLDVLLVERGLVETRTKAQAVIMAGKVYVDGQKAIKSGQVFSDDILLSVKNSDKYVSRGGDKLASVVEALQVDFDGKTIIDVGSSTGGFTDFALQHGAKKIYAVDVGSNQLHYRLRNNDRVVVMERTDIRDVVLPEAVDMAIIDVSFISLQKVLPAVAAHIKPAGKIVAMAKPQFEANKAIADKYRGVIKDESVRQKILNKFEDQIKELGFHLLIFKDSGVSGPKGNLERFYLMECPPSSSFSI